MESRTIRVVARFAAKTDRISNVTDILSALVEPTRAEDGCITYELLHNTQDPTDFTFVEEWTSREALERHLATEHIAECRRRIGEHIEGEADIRVYALLK
jgi:quinol monooxygenase YgiN